MTVEAVLHAHGIEPKGDYATAAVAAEQKLDVRFSADYMTYVSRYGQLTVDGHELTGILPDPYSNVVKTTQAERKFDAEATKRLYVIENLGYDGYVIWQDSLGTIYQTVYDAAPEKLYDNFSDYLTNEVFD